ncbi:hypothetical protein JMJ77_0011123 [Colletotrichum scovillei]|uniref:Uncharacterized protein n=1 Tax=Colletotrichum scovillei TaxID=1209932 RepID=A0A9P7R1I2_9PEZI|nr:hypothetical protein JMJ77_0011123 [Colletotrichum scovillei]KAG7060098.1 hypothetical protein JMJ78_0015377 [Colletotrichum scovillei]KAG7067547.1 hypothetical protein JMJ76_0008979 [Colletotrichum scovillei]
MRAPAFSGCRCDAPRTGTRRRLLYLLRSLITNLSSTSFITLKPQGRFFGILYCSDRVSFWTRCK